MNNAIDLAFLTAKVATLKDEKAKMIVEGVSLAYNIAQVTRFRSMIVELSQICNYIVYKASIYNQLLLNILRVISQKYGHNL